MLYTGGRISAIFVIKSPRCECCFVSLILVDLYDLQMSIVKHFSVGSIKFELGNKKKVEFSKECNDD